MEQLVREGKVFYVGSSNFAGWDRAIMAPGRAAGQATHHFDASTDTGRIADSARPYRGDPPRLGIPGVGGGT
jgi:aryl-alcohol dehydrogenase-like predicted oxidoreductase